MKNEDFKVQLFRFIDVFPCLTTTELLAQPYQEYFGAADQDIPAILKSGAETARARRHYRRQSTPCCDPPQHSGHGPAVHYRRQSQDGRQNLGELRGQGFAFVVDVLGEATVSEQEADQYVATYTELLRELREARKRWTA